MMSKRAANGHRLIAALILVGLLAACAAPPRYICMNARTTSGAHVLICEPFPVAEESR